MTNPCEPLGRQTLLELYGCDPAVLATPHRVREIMLEACRLARATIVTDTFHAFSPHGVSGVVVIAESHVAIHTWPEHGYAAVDVFTCGKTIQPDAIRRHLEEQFAASKVTSVELKRGWLPVPHQDSQQANITDT